MLQSTLENSHHAILYTTLDRSLFEQRIWGTLSSSHTNRSYTPTVLDIETVKEVQRFAEGNNDTKVILISFHTITHPAQNALLKLLEEPKEGVRFILVTSNKEALLPTLLSRVLHYDAHEISTASNDVQLFLKTSPLERIKLPLVQALLTAVDEEGRKKREGVRLFMFALLDELQKKEEFFPYLSKTITLSSYAGDSSSSGKQLMEYISLLLPQSK